MRCTSGVYIMTVLCGYGNIGIYGKGKLAYLCLSIDSTSARHNSHLEREFKKWRLYPNGRIGWFTALHDLGGIYLFPLSTTRERESMMGKLYTSFILNNISILG
jgi:hypothetical protein